MISRYGKAPVSDFGAPSGIRNFQETLKCANMLLESQPMCKTRVFSASDEQIFVLGCFGMNSCRRRWLWASPQTLPRTTWESPSTGLRIWFLVKEIPLKCLMCIPLLHSHFSVSSLIVAGHGCLSSLPSSSSSSLATGLVL